MKGTRTYQEWADFGEKGIPSSGIGLDYSKDRDYILPQDLEEKIQKAWEESGDMYNGDLLNLRDVVENEKVDSRERIICGPTCFKHYHEMKEFLNGEKDWGKYDLSENEIELLWSEVHPLSTFPAVVTQDDKVVMGKKSQQTLDVGAGLISFPGAGYLDREEDGFTSEGTDYTKEPDYMVWREIQEEIGIKNNEIGNITFRGVWEDVFQGSHWNPALFSVVDVELSGDEIKERKDVAEDAWETEGPYILAPVEEPIVLNEFIRSTFRGRKVDEEIRDDVEGLTRIDEVEGTGKAELMLLQLGRHQFGQDWYEEKVDKYDSVELEKVK